mgnify:CR=1 FL=1
MTKLETLLGVTFTDKLLLLSAITHRSFLNENRDASKTTMSVSSFWVTPFLNLL